MSLPYFDWSSTACNGKQAFETVAMASKVAKLSSGRKTAAMNAYKCAICKKFHIGNRVGNSKKLSNKPRRTDLDHDKLL